MANGEESWTRLVSSPSLKHSLLLLNTSRCAKTPSKKNSVHSNTEAAIVTQVCRMLVKVRLWASLVCRFSSLENFESNEMFYCHIICVRFQKTTTFKKAKFSCSGTRLYLWKPFTITYFGVKFCHVLCLINSSSRTGNLL